MTVEEVTVKIKLPKPVHDIVTKLAAVEGSSVDEWYAEWIQRDLAGYLDNAHDVFDVQRLIDSNRLRGIIRLSGE